MTSLTIVRAYYENPSTLAEHLRLYGGMPAEVRENIALIFADDGSPVSPAEPVIRAARPRLPVRLFRLDVDVRWNWLAARNVAMHHMPEGWALITDMDHFTPALTLGLIIDRILRDAISPRVIYRFERMDAPAAAGDQPTPIAPHPNSWLMTREMYWQVGGHDEALSGYYGTDGEYRRRCAAVASVVTLPYHLLRAEHVGDSSTRSYLRKQPEDANGKAIAKARGADWKPKVLSFPYHEVDLSLPPPVSNSRAGIRLA